MKELNITQFDQAGVITDINEYLLNPAAFSEAYNVRFSNGSVESAKGYIEYDPGVVNTTSGWTYVKGVADRMYLLSKEKLRITTADSVEEMSFIAGFDINTETFINTLSNLPVIHNNQTPFGVKSKGDGTQEMFKLDGWGGNMQARNVISYKGYLFAFGVQIDNTRYEDTVFWSDAAAPDTYPKDWGFQLDGEGNISLASPIKGSLGGFNQLSAVGGSIVAADVFGDSLYLFTESEIFRVTEVGGTFIFRFQKVSTGKGAVSPSSVIGLENGLVVIGSNELYVFNGQSSQTLSNGRVGKYLSEKVLSGTQIKMIRDFNEKHLYIFFKQAPTRAKAFKVYEEALVWDWVSNTFSFRDASYCQFEDVTEYRADSLFDVYNKKWSEYDKQAWEGFSDAWQSELKYGTGILACRPQQLLLMNKGFEVIDEEGATKDIPWTLTRTYTVNTLGYPENAVARLHSAQFKGSTFDNLKFAVNDSVGTMRGDKKGFIRVTGKSFKTSYFGSGYMTIPSITLVHSLVGVR